MKRLLLGAVGVVIGLGISGAQACPGVATAPLSTTVAQPGDTTITDISSATKKKKRDKVVA